LRPKEGAKRRLPDAPVSLKMSGAVGQEPVQAPSSINPADVKPEELSASQAARPVVVAAGGGGGFVSTVSLM
jgi:hypothetical protein